MSTICAISTAKGGAIGIIRTSGSDAISITDRIFRNPKGRTLAKAKPYSVVYGNIIDGVEIVDEVLVSVFRGPKYLNFLFAMVVRWLVQVNLPNEPSSTGKWTCPRQRLLPTL